MEMKVYEKLLMVQSELKAPKSNYSEFGKYHYRSCEDILNALKPICKEIKALVYLTDDIVLVGARYYVKTTATFIDIETGETITNNAYAREEENKKGMDASQVTGASSSYARKYALNGLLDIDDTQDADTDSYKGNVKRAEEKEAKQTEEEQDKDYLENLCKEKGIDLSEPKTRAWIQDKLYKASGKANVIKGFNVGQYNNLLTVLIAGKNKEAKENEQANTNN